MRRFALLALWIALPAAVADQTIRVAVAANFKATLEHINASFQADSGHRVLVSSASTGVLYSQIVNGAPFDLFFAADQTSPERLADSRPDLGVDSLFCYALGRLALAGGDGELRQLADPGRSLAIGNPTTAPYGRAALQVLERAEFSPGKERKLVRGNNVAQAYQFWHSGAVDLALVPLSLAPGEATPVPSNWHSPLQQYALVLRRNAAVDAYLNWVRSDTVRALITDAGYEPCP